MSKEKLVYEAKRWLNTALEDFKAAEILLDNKMFSHSCFYFQQAAEKAIKALWYLEEAEPWGHSLLRLIAEAPQKEKYKFLKELESSATFLDKFYIPTRYPNGLPDFTPLQFYTQTDASLGKEESARIIEKIKEIIPS